jgi:hypothetical protein
LIGTINLSVFLLADKSEIDGDTLAMITVLHLFVDSSSNESFSIKVNFEFLYGIWEFASGFNAAKALFLIQSLSAIKDLFISLAYNIYSLSWNWESEEFSEPARSTIKISPGSIPLYFELWMVIWQQEWVREDVSFLKVDWVDLFKAAFSFKSNKSWGQVISNSEAFVISIFWNLFSPTRTGWSLLSKSVTSLPKSYTNLALIDIASEPSSWKCCFSCLLKRSSPILVMIPCMV